jgi:hypothetical protein
MFQTALRLPSKHGTGVSKGVHRSVPVVTSHTLTCHKKLKTPNIFFGQFWVLHYLVTDILN